MWKCWKKLEDYKENINNIKASKIEELQIENENLRQKKERLKQKNISFKQKYRNTEKELEDSKINHNIDIEKLEEKHENEKKKNLKKLLINNQLKLKN